MTLVRLEPAALQPRVKHSNDSGVESFKRFLILSSGGPPVRWSGTIYAILKESIMGTIHVKLYEIWTSGSGGAV